MYYYWVNYCCFWPPWLSIERCYFYLKCWVFLELRCSAYGLDANKSSIEEVMVVKRRKMMLPARKFFKVICHARVILQQQVCERRINGILDIASEHFSQSDRWKDDLESSLWKKIEDLIIFFSGLCKRVFSNGALNLEKSHASSTFNVPYFLTWIATHNSSSHYLFTSDLHSKQK